VVVAILAGHVAGPARSTQLDGNPALGPLNALPQSSAWENMRLVSQSHNIRHSAVFRDRKS
jgi:hypothetical protein